MITDAQGRPIVTEGIETRSIKIGETKLDGKLVWAVDFQPSVGAFAFEEVMMILGDVTRGIAQQALSRVAEAKGMQKVRAQMDALSKEK